MTENTLADPAEVLASLGVRDALQAAGPGDAQPVYDPSTGRVLCEVPASGGTRVADTITAAAEAQRAWGRLPLADRIDMLAGLVGELVRRRSEFATLDALNSGNPLRACHFDVDDIVRYFQHWSAMARTMQLSRYGADFGAVHYDDPFPYGVVLRITAFNKPLYFAVGGALMPLLMGNAVIVKPAPQTPLSAIAFAALAARHLPPGLVSAVPGDVATAQALITSPAIRRIAFTGSAATGLAIQRSCAATGMVKHLTMELGGKNAIIVLPDVDLDAAADAVVRGSSFRTTQGQSCQATSRVLAHDDIHDSLLDRVSARLDVLRMGTAYDPSTDVGPLVTAAHRERVRALVDSGLSLGATVRHQVTADTGGAGFYFTPLLLADVEPSMTIAQEEIFGPVLTATRVGSIQQAVDIANSVRYGLTAAVWSKDIDVALSVASSLESGYVWVNDVAQHYPGAPFGGVKDSGVGSEESSEALRSFTQQRSIHVKLHTPSR